MLLLNYSKIAFTFKTFHGVKKKLNLTLWIFIIHGSFQPLRFPFHPLYSYSSNKCKASFIELWCFYPLVLNQIFKVCIYCYRQSLISLAFYQVCLSLYRQTFSLGCKRAPLILYWCTLSRMLDKFSVFMNKWP